jgi:hypothetical protein
MAAFVAFELWIPLLAAILRALGGSTVPTAVQVVGSLFGLAVPVVVGLALSDYLADRKGLVRPYQPKRRAEAQVQSDAADEDEDEELDGEDGEAFEDEQAFGDDEDAAHGDSGRGDSGRGDSGREDSGREDSGREDSGREDSPHQDLAVHDTRREDGGGEDGRREDGGPEDGAVERSAERVAPRGSDAVEPSGTRAGAVERHGRSNAPAEPVEEDALDDAGVRERNRRR